MAVNFIILALQAQSGSSLLQFVAPIGLMLIVAYFLLILPQQKRQKQWQTMLDALKAGDRVITSGGIRGTVIALKEDALHLRVPPDNLRIEVSKASVVSVANADEGK
jgi:preprotein translocase subunit YajC